MILQGSTWDHPRGLDPLVTTSAAFNRTQILWEARSLQAFGETSIKDLAERYDLIVIDHPHVGSCATEDTLLQLDQWIPEETMQRIAKETIGPCHESYHWAGHQWALAIDAACQVSAYLPERLGSPPQGWPEVMDVARTGEVVWPLKAADAFASLCTILLGEGITPATTDEFVSPQDGVSALERMEELARHIPDWCLDADPISALEMISRGDASYCPLLYGYSNYSRPGFRERVVKFSPAPGGKGSILGGAGLAVSAATRDPQSAVEFATWVASPEIQAGSYFSSGGQPAGVAAWEDSAVNAASSDFFRNTRTTIEHAWVRPRHHGFVEAHQRIGEEIGAFLRNPRDPSATVDAINQWYSKSFSG